MPNPHCPICETPSAPIGPVVHNTPTLVAGVPINLGDRAFSIHRCPQCGLQFKDPVIPQEELMACYNASPSGNWESNPDPIKRRFDTLRDTARQHTPGNRILDVGCSNGALLQFMGDAFDRFGIEPSTDAARVAEKRGVRILAPTIETLDPDERFDTILAIDLLEHLENPNAFLSNVMDHLRPGGIFIGFTGTTDARSWKLQGSRYWYVSLPEHIVFYSRSTITILAEKHGAELVSYQETSHQRARSSRRIRDTIRNRVWSLKLRHNGLGVQAWKNEVREQSPPGWLSAPDHMLFTLRKNPDA